MRVAAISYLNTLPFIYGLKNYSIKDNLQLLLNTPAEGAENILSGKADVGIIPVASLLQMPEGKIVSDYCIGAEGPVASVMLCSNVPLHMIEHIFLDTESMTSVLLTHILCKKFWGINPSFKRINYAMCSWEQISSLSAITNRDAVNEGYVIIGDKAMANAGRFIHQYDLADEWIKFLGMPFVFGAWIAANPLPDSFIEDFNKALAFGVNNIESAVNSAENITDKVAAMKYLKENISYPFTEGKRKAVETFLKLAKEVIYD